MGLAALVALTRRLGGRGDPCPPRQQPPGAGDVGRELGGDLTAARAGFRIGGEVHSMVWDPTGERLAVIIRGERCLHPCLPQCRALPENPRSSRQKGRKPR